MPSREIILSTCGTSLLTNEMRDSDRRQQLFRLTNLKDASEAPDDVRPWIEHLIADVESSLLDAPFATVAKKSAELNSILKFYDGRPPTEHSRHLLLCTDTWLGEATARIIESWLRKHGASVSLIRQRDLQTADLEAFQLALSELVRWSDETFPGYKQSGYRVVFNLTGGFKSVQGFLQTLAAFYADEVIYVFQEANTLMRIPRLPIAMNAGDLIEKHLESFRRLAMGLPVVDTSDVPETLLMTVAGQVALSPWGQLVWEQCRKEVYRTRLWPPPSARIRYGDRFESSLQSLFSDRLTDVNRKIDHLAHYLESNLDRRSLDLKQLKGAPAPPSTHEIDAWSDQDAKRIFGHYEGGVFVLDKLDRHL